MAWKSGQSYSADLRSRVLAAVDGGIPARSVAERFQVSVSYIYKALGRRDATGETEARPQRNHQKLRLAAQHQAIRAASAICRRPLLRSRIERFRRSMVAQRPDVTLNELRAWLLATYGVAASPVSFADIPPGDRCAMGIGKARSIAFGAQPSAGSPAAASSPPTSPTGP